LQVLALLQVDWVACKCSFQNTSDALWLTHTDYITYILHHQYAMQEQSSKKYLKVLRTQINLVVSDVVRHVIISIMTS